MMATLTARICLLALVVTSTGCGAPPPMEGERLARLKASIADARLGPLRIAAVGPEQLVEGGPGATIVMRFTDRSPLDARRPPDPSRPAEPGRPAEPSGPAEAGKPAEPSKPSGGERLTEFALYDGYFKVAFALTDELRALGIDARIEPALWQARAEALAATVREAKESGLDFLLAGLNAQGEIQALYRLGIEEKRGLFVSRGTLLAARTGLPPEMTARKAALPSTEPPDSESRKVTAREVRDAYFTADRAPPASLTLTIAAVELEAAAERGPDVDRRTGRALLRFTLRQAGKAQPIEDERECAAVSEPAGVSFDRKGRAQLTFGADDPLERAIRGALRAFLERALPKLAEGG